MYLYGRLARTWDASAGAEPLQMGAVVPSRLRSNFWTTLRSRERVVPLGGARKSPVALSPGLLGRRGGWLPRRGRLAAGAGLAGLPRLEAGAGSPEGK